MDPLIKFSMFVKKYTVFMRYDVTHVFFTVLNAGFCLFFIVRAYSETYPIWMRGLETLGNIIFMLQIAVEFSGSYTKVLYTVSAQATTNILAISSLLYCVTNNFYLGFGFLRAVNLMHHIEQLKFKENLCNRILKEMILLVLTVITYVFVFAGVIFIVESLGDLPGISYVNDEWTVYNAFYYMIVTLSTVGYGDFFATTFIGRILMMCAIAVGIIVFGAKTGELVDIMRSNNAGHGKFRNPDYSRFVVVCGRLNEEILELVLAQVLHPEKLEKSPRDSRVVAIVPSESEFQSLKSYFSNATSKLSGTGVSKKLQIFVGNPLDEADMSRVLLEDAEAIYILSPEMEGAEVEADDLRQLFTAVAVRRYLKVKKVDVPIKVTVSQRKYWQLYQHPLLSDPSADIDVVCMDKLIMGLLASSAFAPGFLTFLESIITSISDEDLIKGSEHDPEWLKCYLKGVGNEIFVFLPMDQYFGMDFWELNRELSEKSILLLGYVRKNGWVYLAPSMKDKLIPKNAYLVALAGCEKDLAAYKASALVEFEKSKMGAIPMAFNFRDSGIMDGYSKVNVIIRQKVDTSAAVVERIKTVAESMTALNLNKVPSEQEQDDDTMYTSALVQFDKERVARFKPFALELSSLDGGHPITFEIYGGKEDVEDVDFVESVDVKPNEFISALEKMHAASVEDAKPFNYKFQGLGEGKKKGTLEFTTPGIGAHKTKDDIKVVDRQFQAKARTLVIKQPNTQRAVGIAKKVKNEETNDGFRADGKGLYMTHIYDGKQTLIQGPKGLGGSVEHIVIFDPKPSNLKYLLRPLKRREAIIKTVAMKIIIVHRERLSDVLPKLSNAMNLTKGVYWISNGLRGNELFHAIRIHKAWQVMVCESFVKDEYSENSNYDLPSDAPGMFLTVRVREFIEREQTKGSRYVPVVTELGTDSTLGYLRYWNDERLITHPLICEGCVVRKSIPQLLLMQSQENKFLVNVFNALMLTSGREGLAQVFAIRVRSMVNGFGFAGRL
ncbi:hypothetical protein AAMO2058_001404900 [Amorphochlora amoebiformis]